MRLCKKAKVVVCVWLLSVFPAQAARLAFVAGNDRYAHIAPLQNAVYDAQSMARALEEAGYTTTLSLNADLKTLKDALRGFRQRIQGGDEVVFFFSGHGVSLGGQNYLLPVDVRSGSPDEVRDDSLSLGQILSDVRERRPDVTVAIIDACRDSPFSGHTRSLTPSSGTTGEMILFAAGEGQEALDRLSVNDPVRNGVFTRVLLEEMRRPGVPIHEVMRKVRWEVHRLAQSIDHQQVPALYDQVVGEFFFVKPGVSAAVASTVAPAAVSAPASGAQRQAGEVFRDCPQCPEMVVIPAGRFTMGSPDSEPGRDSDEGPQRTVRIARAFALGRTEVTVGQFRAFVGETGYRTDAQKNADNNQGCYAYARETYGGWAWRAGRHWQNPGFAQGEGHPVVCVSWNDAQTYVAWLSEKTGQRYRLPSEAEWEYAARAGTQTSRYWGDDPNHACRYANVADQTKGPNGQTWTSSHACEDGYWFTAPVENYRPNPFKLHDMLGNVWEWAQDCWNDNYVNVSTDGRAWEIEKCQRRVLRGGAWFIKPENVRAANRNRDAASYRSFITGFRPARLLP
jgi:formylglycine-generating enzyme required for sulfatase activity